MTRRFIDAIECTAIVGATLFLLVLFLCTAGHAQQTAHYGKHGKAVLPDKSLTPGAVRSTNVDEVCDGGSTTQFRHTTASQKNQAYKLYGAEKKPGVCCEVDHLISLELGGADDIKNLWPQPYSPAPGAHEKDLVENWLHKQVCENGMPLKAAQRSIASDWYAVYLEMKKEQ